MKGMSLKGWLRVVVQVVVGLAIAWFVGLYRQSAREGSEGTNKVFVQAVQDTRTLLRVTSLEGVRSVPVTREKDGVGVFALGYYRFRISYEIEQLQYFIQGDTLRIQMPPAVVSVLEHEEYGFQVLDVWGTNIWKRLTGARLPLEEENELREAAIRTLRYELYQDGTVARADEHAKELILNMLSLVPGTVIIDERKARPLESSLIPSEIFSLGTDD